MLILPNDDLPLACALALPGKNPRMLRRRKTRRCSIATKNGRLGNRNWRAASRMLNLGVDAGSRYQLREQRRDVLTFDRGDFNARWRDRLAEVAAQRAIVVRIGG
jgi:hypothetical protein